MDSAFFPGPGPGPGLGPYPGPGLFRAGAPCFPFPFSFPSRLPRRRARARGPARYAAYPRYAGGARAARCVHGALTVRVQRAHAYGAVLGFVGDLLFGDPARGHPVAVFGRLAAAAERVLWRDRRGAGAVHTALCVGVAVAAVRGTARVASGMSARTASRAPAGSAGSGASAVPRGRGGGEVGQVGCAAVALASYVTWAALGGASLCAEAEAVAAALESGDLAGARRRLPRLCGRDPEALDADGVARAAVESVAENTSDAVVGALLWGAVAGPSGVAAFRAVNTLDAMVGHRSPRHLRFGWAAARLDDVAGWPGARLTALLAAVAGPSPRGALRVWRDDGRRHPSPNAGPVEAAFAGALGVRLGGTLAYGGRVEDRPLLGGAGGRAVCAGDVGRAVRLSRRVGVLALLVTAGGRLAGTYVRSAGSSTHTGTGTGTGTAVRTGITTDTSRSRSRNRNRSGRGSR